MIGALGGFNVGALIIRTGFGSPFFYSIMRKPQNSDGNLGPDIRVFTVLGLGV